MNQKRALARLVVVTLVAHASMAAAVSGVHAIGPNPRPTSPSAESTRTPSDGTPEATTPVPLGLQTLSPARLLDTRPGQTTVDGLFSGGGQVAGGASLKVEISGRGGVPESGIGAVVLNVTAVKPVGTGYVTVHSSDIARPVASSLNLSANQTIPNLVITDVAGDGTITIFTSATTHLLVDVVGYLAPMSATSPENTVVLDTDEAELGEVAGSNPVELNLRRPSTDLDLGDTVIYANSESAYYGRVTQIRPARGFAA